MTPLKATGPGAGARNSIGITLVSGMIIGTAFTLFVVPAVYTVIAKTHRADETVLDEGLSTNAYSSSSARG